MARAEVTGAHWDDYAVTATDGAAALTATVPDPYGDVFLGQQFLADDYRGTVVTLCAEVRAEDLAGQAELTLEIVSPPGDHGTAPGPVPIRRPDRGTGRQSQTITGSQDWTSYELTAPVPGDAEHLGFELTLAGAGQLGLRNLSFSRAG